MTPCPTLPPSVLSRLPVRLPLVVRLALAMLIPLLAALALTAVIPAAQAQAGPLLFQDYAFGAPRAELAARPGMFDCSQDLGPEALCLRGVSYLERSWEADFAFVNGKLRSVSLVAPFDSQVYTLAFAQVVKDSALVAMQSTAGVMDLTALLITHQDNPEAFDQAVTDFEAQGMADGALAYIFLEKKAMAVAATQARSLDQLLAWAEQDIRQTVLVLTSGQGQDWIALIFECPNLEPDLGPQP